QPGELLRELPPQVRAHLSTCRCEHDELFERALIAQPRTKALAVSRHCIGRNEEAPCGSRLRRWEALDTTHLEALGSLWANALRLALVRDDLLSQAHRTPSWLVSRCAGTHPSPRVRGCQYGARRVHSRRSAPSITSPAECGSDRIRRPPG